MLLNWSPISCSYIVTKIILWQSNQMVSLLLNPCCGYFLQLGQKNSLWPTSPAGSGPCHLPTKPRTCPFPTLYHTSHTDHISFWPFWNIPLSSRVGLWAWWSPFLSHSHLDTWKTASVLKQPLCNATTTLSKLSYLALRFLFAKALIIFLLFYITCIFMFIVYFLHPPNKTAASREEQSLFCSWMFPKLLEHCLDIVGTQIVFVKLTYLLI